jgi:hypothetical protein
MHLKWPLNITGEDPAAEHEKSQSEKRVRTETSVQSGEHSTCTADRKFALLTPLERSHHYAISLFSFGFK